MKKESLYLLAAGAAVAAWWLFRRSGPSGGGSGSGGGGGGGQMASQPATSFTTNVKPGGGVATVPGRTVGTGGLQSGIALAGDISGIVKGFGQMFGDAWKGVKSVFSDGFETTPIKDINTFNQWADAMSPTGDTFLGSQADADYWFYNMSGGAGTPYENYDPVTPEPNWGTPDNVVLPTGYENTVPYSDSPWGAY